MEDYTQSEIDSAIQAILEMIEKSQGSLSKFEEGSSQNSLLRNRINALEFSVSLLENHFTKSEVFDCSYPEIESSISAIKSLISKSEKAQSKVKIDSWQYDMLKNNLFALRMALSLLEKPFHAI